MASNDQKNSIFAPLYFLTTKKAVLLIIIIGLVVFSNTLFNGFVWDDLGFIINNPDVHALNIAHLFGPNFFNTSNAYHPIAAVFYALIYVIFGSNAFPYHLIQLYLHIANAVLVFLVLRSLFSRFRKVDITSDIKSWDKMSGSEKVKYMRKHGMQKASTVSANTSNELDFVALLLAVIFLVDPIQIESASYIASYGYLSFFFGILALWVIVSKALSIPKQMLISALLLLSLLVKETGAGFFIVIIGYLAYFDKRKFISILVFECIAVAIYFLLRFGVGGHILAPFLTHEPIPMLHATFAQRSLSIPAIILYYIYTTIVPISLSIDQQWIVTTLSIKDFYLPLFIDCAFFAALIWYGIFLSKFKREYLSVYVLFFVWFLVGLSFIIQIFPLEMTVADRYFYFPIVGLLGMLGVFIHMIVYSENGEDKVLDWGKIKMVSVIFIAAFSLRSIVRNTNYYNDLTLFSHDSQVQDNAIIEDTVASDEAISGNLQDAFVHLQKSINITPFADNYYHLANLYQQTGNLQGAKEYYVKALNTANQSYNTPGYSHEIQSDEPFYVNLINILLLLGEYNSAQNTTLEGLRYYPQSVALLEELSISEYALNNRTSALATIQKAQSLGNNQFANSLYGAMLKQEDIKLDQKHIVKYQNPPKVFSPKEASASAKARFR